MMIGLILGDIANPYFSHSYLVNEMRMGTAIVFIDRIPRYLAADAVVTDNRAGAAQGVRHLIEHGHRRIAYLGDLSSISTAQERYAGYQDAFREAGLESDDRLIRHDLHTIDAAEAAATGIAHCSQSAHGTAQRTEPDNDRP